MGSSGFSRRGVLVTELTLSKITKRFDDSEILTNLSLEIPHAQRHALIGPNGAGKSTLLNILTGDYQPDSGEVFLEGKNITNHSVEARARKGIARTLQTSSLFDDLSVEENLLAASHRGSSIWRFEEQSHQGVGQIADQLGLDEYFKERAKNLSHGDKRLLEIGMALATQPKILLMDEPMAGLSQTEREKVVRILRNIENVTLFFVEHDMDVVFGLAEQISVLVQGQIISKGPPEEVQSNPKVQEIYLGQSNA